MPIAVAVLVLLVGGGVAAWVLLRGGGSPARSTFTVRGEVTITDPNAFRSTGAGCAGTSGYDDLREGAQVTVTDDNGTVLAASQLPRGADEGNGACRFLIEIPDVPLGKGFYGVAVGAGDRREPLRYSEADIVDNGVQLVIGAD